MNAPARHFEWRHDRLVITDVAAPPPAAPPAPPQPVVGRPSNSTDEAPEMDRRALVRASDMFAHRLGLALQRGEESLASLRSPVIEAERPLPFVVVSEPQGPASPQQPTRIAERLRRQQFIDALRLRAQPHNDGPAPRHGRYTLLHLSDATCRFPTTDALPHFFCGAPVTRGAYCAQHAQVCFK